MKKGVYAGMSMGDMVSFMAGEQEYVFLKEGRNSALPKDQAERLPEFLPFTGLFSLQRICIAGWSGVT